MIWVWVVIAFQLLAIIMLMAAVGHLKKMNDKLWAALVGSSKITDQNFMFIAQRLAEVATIVALKNDDLTQNIDLQKVSTDKLPN